MNNQRLSALKIYLAFPFQGERWKEKLLVGALVVFLNFIIPIIPMIFLCGYIATMVEQIINQRREPFLPEWKDWGDLFIRGLRVFGVNFLYTLPVLIVTVVSYSSMMILPLIMTLFSKGDKDLFVWVFVAEIVTMIVFMCGMALATVLGLVASFLLPPALMNTMSKGKFSAGFRVKEWWSVLRANLGGFLVAYLVTWGLFMFMMIVYYLLYFSIILCIIIPVVLSAMSIYMALVTNTLIASAYREGLEKLAALPQPNPQP